LIHLNKSDVELHIFAGVMPDMMLVNHLEIRVRFRMTPIGFDVDKLMPAHGLDQ
jgi:hypothetical protein